MGIPVCVTGIPALALQNGSLTRQRVRDEVAGGDWARFNAMLGASAPGNGGAVGFFFDQVGMGPSAHAARPVT